MLCCKCNQEMKLLFSSFYCDCTGTNNKTNENTGTGLIKRMNWEITGGSISESSILLKMGAFYKKHKEVFNIIICSVRPFNSFNNICNTKSLVKSKNTGKYYQAITLCSPNLQKENILVVYIPLIDSPSSDTIMSFNKAYRNKYFAN